MGWLAQWGLAAMTLWVCLRLYWRILFGQAALDMPAFAAALRQTGLSMTLAMTLVALALGLIIGNQIQAMLTSLYLPGLAILSITHLAVIELVPILVGILVAGRAGVALAVRQASLTVGSEMDGLLIQGIDPRELMVAPVLLAMLAMSFAFSVWVTLVTFSTAFLWLWVNAGISPALFLDALRRALTPGDLIEALIKPLVFALLIAMIATVNGTLHGRTTSGVAQAATRTMIAAVVTILIVDLLFVLGSRG